MHFNSNNRHSYKCAAMINSLKKVDYMASDDIRLIGSALDKLREFAILGYPKGMLYDACTKMAVVTRAQASVVYDSRKGNAMVRVNRTRPA